MTVRLSDSGTGSYDPGRPFLMRALWLVVEGCVLLNPLVTSYGLKTLLLRAFGARIGQRLVIKPNVHIKYPWRLALGDDVWLGEQCWVDNFADVNIGSNVCVSQGAYLCTGNHDWSDPTMPLIVKGIVVEDGAWIGAHARIAPGLVIGTEAVITLGAVLLESAESRGIYAGNPAHKVGVRKFR